MRGKKYNLFVKGYVYYILIIKINYKQLITKINWCYKIYTSSKIVLENSLTILHSSSGIARYLANL